MDCSGRGSEGLADVTAGIDRLIEAGVKDLAAARMQLSRIQREIEAIEGRLIELRRARALVVGERSVDSEQHLPPGKESTKEITELRNGSLAALVRDCAADALRGAGRPLNRVELLELVRANGVQVDGKDPAKRVGRIMWSSKQFQHVGDGYWFSGEPVPSPAT